MDDLIQLVATKTGISQDSARQAVSMVLDYVKKKLPPPLAEQLDQVVAGDTSGLADVAGGLAKGLGSVFGKK